VNQSHQFCADGSPVSYWPFSVLNSPAVTLEPVRASSHPVQPVRKEFLALAKEHTLVPVCRTLTADLETPVSAFLRAAWAARECFLLESVEGGEQVGRYTFIGLAPFKRIVARGRNITITEGRKVTRLEDDVLPCCAGRFPATSRPGFPACLHSRPVRWLFCLRCGTPDRAVA